MKTSLRFFTVVVCWLLSSFSYANEYIFIGNGEWAVSSNWAAGIVPPASLPYGSTIIIRGNAGIGITCTTNCLPSTLSLNHGRITIVEGSTLTFQNSTRFSLTGSIIVDGTMINKTTFEIFQGSSIAVKGRLINQKSINNQGTIIVNDGGVIDNQLMGIFKSSASYNPDVILGTIILNAGGIIFNTHTAILHAGNLKNYGGTIDNQSTISGNTIVTGNLANGAILASGNSPGSFAISGDYIAFPTAKHTFEIGGALPGSFDRLDVGGSVTLNGHLNVSFNNGFAPNENHDIPIITGKIKGKFSTLNIPLKYAVVYEPNAVLLRFNSALPVVYMKLDAKKEGNAARLEWIIHNELNVAKYEVQRSTNGKDFLTIGQALPQLQLQGHYSFLDSRPGQKCFYRIKNISTDGRITFSLIITYNQGKAYISLSVFPSVAHGMLRVQHESAGAGSKITVVGLDGRVTHVIYPGSGNQTTSVDLSVLTAGSYIIQYQNASGERETSRFIKL